MILKLSMDYQGLKVYRVYLNVDIGLTLTYFTVRSNLIKFAYCAYSRPWSSGFIVVLPRLSV